MRKDAETGQKKDKKKEILLLGSIPLFFTLTFVFFAPMEVILLNGEEFNYTFESFWWFQLLVTVLAAGLMTLVICLLPRKWKTAAAALLLGAGTAAWVQMLFMNGNMIRLTGEQMQVSGTEKAVNLLIWAVIAGGIFLACVILERKKKPVRIWMGAMAGFLSVIQLVAFVSLLMTTNFEADRDRHGFTRRGEFELSSGTNVVMFIFDAADGEFVHQVLDTYPEVSEQLSGWVYYPNAVSEYSRTFPALTYMLSGEKCYLDSPRKEYVDAAFEKSDYLRNLHDCGTDIRIYTMDSGLVSTKADDMIGNVRKGTLGIGDLNLIGLEKGLARVSLFKCMPYAIKKWFSYDVDVLNILAFNDRSYYENDRIFYGNLKAGKMTTTDRYPGAFRLYHLWSAHGAADWNDLLETVDTEQPPYVRLRGSFRVLDLYCEKMKQEGIYDDALIIVAADHGKSTGDRKKLIQNKAVCPLLMVKYPHAESTGKLETNRAPVCQEDLFATVTDTLKAKRSTAGSGRTLQDIQETEERERNYYYIALDARLNPILLREYVIRGDAEDFANWEETGNVWNSTVEW